MTCEAGKAEGVFPTFATPPWMAHRLRAGAPRWPSVCLEGGGPEVEPRFPPMGLFPWLSHTSDMNNGAPVGYPARRLAL